MSNQPPAYPRRGLEIMDQAALALAVERRVLIHIVPADNPDAARQAVEGLQIGSVIWPAEPNTWNGTGRTDRQAGVLATTSST